MDKGEVTYLSSSGGTKEARGASICDRQSSERVNDVPGLFLAFEWHVFRFVNF